MINSIALISAAIIVVYGPPGPRTLDDPPIPPGDTNGVVHVPLNDGTYTNLVGVPVIRFSLSTSDATNFTGVTLVTTNSGFIITPTNTIFIGQANVSSERDKYYFGTWSVINTSSNRSWHIQARIGPLEDGGGAFWSGFSPEFNGQGTNEYTLQGWYNSSIPVTYFRVKDTGAAH